MFVIFLFNAIRFSTTFMFGCTGETITEKGGNLNLGIPGIMCVGAVGGCIGESIYLKSLSDISRINPFLAVLIPILFAMLFSGALGMLYCFLTVTLRCNQNVTGLAITTFGVGFTNFFITLVDKTNFNVASKSFTKFFPIQDASNWFVKLFLSYGVMVYLAVIIAIIAAIILNKTRLGLNLKAVGENPATADAAGISVTAYKYGATGIGSAIAGLGGLFYIMDYLNGSWEYSIDAMGWLAIALVIFSIWRPNWGILGSILFGALYIAPSYLNVSFSQKELLKMIPYIVTIFVLIVSSIRNKKENQPPASLGLSYFREER
ncbi:MAG TPA: ABC transporter permease [Clostridia bacterium]|nr:ABC transporter permease [Clostridia bacterium]HOK81338.1 ABC transporter permease [Clostridia bacterium]HOL60457.1 ABC transporter permease [Clostridia bacterium]HPO53214.1 ABC transporter permease [Clostridia bacterium]